MTDDELHVCLMRIEVRLAQLERERACEWLSIDSVVAKFNVTRRSVYNWIYTERVDAMRTPTGTWRIRVASILKKDSAEMRAHRKRRYVAW